MQEDTAVAPALTAMLDDSTAGAALIECAAGLARRLHRSLALVYVEDTVALSAAVLPQTRVLAHAGAEWSPFGPADIERAWRAQASRLRTLAGDIVPRHAVAWSLSTVRAVWPRAAIELFEANDLLFIGASRRLPRQPTGVVLLLDDGSAAAGRALVLAQALSESLRANLLVRPLAEGDVAAQPVPQALACVLPRGRATPAQLRRATCPLLLVA